MDEIVSVGGERGPGLGALRNGWATDGGLDWELRKNEWAPDRGPCVCRAPSQHSWGFSSNLFLDGWGVGVK